jgi:uncharacterized delta-60 repeat protein
MKCTRLAVAAVFGCYFLASTLLSRGQPGSLDITFNPGSGVGAYLGCIALQTNGQILVGGSFNTVNGITYNEVARLNSDGSVDSSFNVGQGPQGGGVNCIGPQSDGKVVIVGDFATVNNIVNYGVARLRTDASVDVNFQPATFITTSITRLAVQNDQRILIAGMILFFNGTSDTHFPVARLNGDGSFDSSFAWGTVNTSMNKVTDMSLQPNGQILVAVPVISVNGISRTNVARLNSDGTIDTGFTADPMVGSPGRVNCVLGLTNGQVLIGGSFDTINGYTRQGIARLDSDGSLDTSFGRAYSTYAPYVFQMALQPDGRILINDNVGSNPHRLNANGQDDASFSSGTGLDGYLEAIAVQPDGKILIGGTFTTYNGTNITRIARLNGDNPPSTNLQFLAANLYFGTYLQGTVSNTYRIEWTGNPNTHSLWTPLFNVMLQTNPQFILDPNPASGRRFYRAVQVAP